MKLISILHLSDLHRSNLEPVNNDTLLSSLLSDRDRYLLELPKIRSPDLAIISGDIIQGVGLGVANYSEEIRNQYAVAKDFLVRLAAHFFDGDRSRIVIVPGNHDICWNTAFAAMELVESKDEPPKVGPNIFQPSSNFRWNWLDRKMRKISSRECYDKRTDLYAEFVADFYCDAGLKFPINSKDEYNLFEFDGGRIVVAAFNSTFGNDCFCNHGSIKDGTIGIANLKIRELNRSPILRIAAWHHSVQGPPHRDDYMDISTVHEMIGFGFRLGLHGHQHQADAGAYNIHLPEEHSMAIVSAGSLCAGANELPRGTNRQYNILQIREDYSGVRIHAREMAQGNQFGRSRQGLFSPEGYVDVSWLHSEAEFQKNSAKIASFIQSTVIAAENALHGGLISEAVALLSTIDLPAESHQRRLYVEAALIKECWKELVEFLNPPVGPSEFSILIRAYEGINQCQQALKFLARSEEYGIDAATKIALTARIELRLALGK